MRRHVIRLVITCIMLLPLCSCTANKDTLSSLPETVSDSFSGETYETLLQNQFLITGGIRKENGEIQADLSNGAKKVSYDEIKRYKGEFQEFNPNYFWKFLSENEKILYNMLLYMSENNCENIIFSRDLADLDSIEKVMICAQLDYPSMETNSTNLVKEQEISIGNETFLGYLVHLSAYRKDKMEKNLQALDKAAEIVSTMPPQLGDNEKAAYLFRYLVEHVTYCDVDKKNTVYLYSALCEEASDCDGFANAYSLLCNMAGLECIKVTYHPNELKAYLDTHTELGERYKKVDRGSGHIWNMVRIDGEYYHYDSSSSVRAMEREKVPSKILMGASDRVALNGVEYPPDISPYVPISAGCLYSEEILALTDEHYEDELEAIRTQLKENIYNGKNYVYFLLEGKLFNDLAKFNKAVDAVRDDYSWNSGLPNRQGEVLIMVYHK